MAKGCHLKLKAVNSTTVDSVDRPPGNMAR